MARGAWLTPNNQPPTKYWVRRLLIPADIQYVEIVNGALIDLCYPSSFEAYGTATPQECADAFSLMYQQYIQQTEDAPFWGDEEDVDGEPQQPWYDNLADWIIEGFLAISGFPTAAIVYSTSVPKIRMAFRTGNFGALFRILLDNIEMYTGDSYAAIRGLLGHTLDLQQFALDNDLGAGPWELRIEHNGSGPNIPEGQTAYLEVVRKRLQDEMPIQFRQVDPCLLEYSEDGSTWETAADLSLCTPEVVKIATILPYGGAVAPEGYLMCDGQAVSRQLYGTLYATIGTNFGPGDGQNTFNVPDLRGRAPIGAGTGDGLTNRPLATEWGEETHTLSVGELATHSHAILPSDNAGYFLRNVAGDYYYTGEGGLEIEIATNTDNAGSGEAHENMQPSLALNFIIKY